MAAHPIDIERPLSAEAEAIRQFVEVLQREQAVLASGDTDALPAFAEQKDKLATQLSELARQRNAMLVAQGCTPDRSGMERWLASRPGHKNIDAIWKKLLSLAGEARELNRLNGELIQMRLQYNSKALEILLRKEESLDLYGPDGLSKPLDDRRINDAV